MTQHSHTIPRGANKTASVTDPDLTPYAKAAALAGYATTASVATILNPDPKVVGSMANVLWRLAAVEKPYTPPPVTPPPSTGIYGSGIGSYSLAQTTLGYTGPLKMSFRFRAAVTSALTVCKVYLQGATTGGGYGGGTCGTARFTVQTDDGTSNHFPSGTVLATVDYVHQDNDADFPVTFSSPPSLTAGTLYHLVCQNVDASPTVNYFSLNHLIQNSGSPQPIIADLDWASMYWDSDGYWVPRTGFTPILDVGYSSGFHQGMGYMEMRYGSNKGTIGAGNANQMLRELFTVSGGSRVITGAAIRVMQDGSGTSPLTVGLYTGGGSLIDSFTVAASAIPDGTLSANPTGEAGAWVSGSFSTTHTLSNGTQYFLRFSTAADTTYYSFPIRRGNGSYNYDVATVFADGLCQQTTDGSTWVAAGGASDNDLQFYFMTAS